MNTKNPENPFGVLNPTVLEINPQKLIFLCVYCSVPRQTNIHKSLFNVICFPSRKVAPKAMSADVNGLVWR